ncbi:MAG: hypothetical protein ACREBV_00120 [Candidatus Zixiibacteriota bacterium]
MNSQKQAVALIALIFCLFLSSIQAVVPQLINFQCRITDNLGNPIAVPVDLTLKVYDIDVGGAPLFQESFDDVVPNDGGIASIPLGWQDSFDWQVGAPLWLGVTVNTDPELTPRTRILSVPYALVSSGVSGDVETKPAEILLAGRVDNPPQLIIRDDPAVTPTIDESLLLNDLSVALVVDRGAGDVDRTELKADGLKIYYPSGVEAISFAPGAVVFNGTPVDFDGSEAQFLGSSYLSTTSIDPNGVRLKSLDAPPIPLPPSGEPYLAVSDDIINQLFYSMVQSGKLKVACESAGTLAELLPDCLEFTSNSGLDLGLKVCRTGLEAHGGSVQLLDGCDLTVTGTLDLSGGTLDLGSSSLDVGSNLTVGGSLTVDGGGSFTSGSTLTLTGVGTPITTLSQNGLSSDLGSVVIYDGSGPVTLRTTVTAGNLEIDGSGTFSLDASGVKFSDGSTDAFIRRIGDVVKFEIPPIATAGLDLGGTVTFTNPKLMKVTTGSGVRFESGSFCDYLGITNDIHIDGDELRVRGGTLLVEPSGGGAGGRVSANVDEVRLTNDLAVDYVRLHRTDGLVAFAGSLGGSAVYRYDGVQLTGPDVRRLDATRSSISLTRSSGNRAFVCTLDDPSNLLTCDIDDDGLADVAMGSDVVSPYMHLSSICRLRCDGTAEFDDMAAGGTVTVAGAAELNNQLTINGVTISNSDWTCDANNDATVDVSVTATPAPRLYVAAGTVLDCEGDAALATTTIDVNADAVPDVVFAATPTPELLVTLGTRFSCEGDATFTRPVAVNSDLTVTGSLLVMGPKAFVQEHPVDATKEIVYVALEGNESGTYTRGSSHLKNGVARIELPEDFHFVTNDAGLTAQVTPRGLVNSMLYVESITPTTLVVKSSNKKDENVKFDFMVNGIRKGFENHQVIRDKTSLAIND